MAKKAVTGEVVSKTKKDSANRNNYAFKPMAGFFLLYSIALLGLVFTLDGGDYDSLLERAFWVVITIGLAVGIHRHWPAMRQLLFNRRNK